MPDQKVEDPLPGRYFCDDLGLNPRIVLPVTAARKCSTIDVYYLLAGEAAPHGKVNHKLGGVYYADLCDDYVDLDEEDELFDMGIDEPEN